MQTAALTSCLVGLSKPKVQGIRNLNAIYVRDLAIILAQNKKTRFHCLSTNLR